jgi:hypothetical protein
VPLYNSANIPILKGEPEMKNKLLWYNVKYYLTVLINPALVFLIYFVIVTKTHFVGTPGMIFTFSVGLLVFSYFYNQLWKLEEEWKIIKRERKRERERKNRNNKES